MLIRPVQPDEATAWERMRQSLWPSSPGEHAAEIASFFEGKRTTSVEALLAFDEEGQPREITASKGMQDTTQIISRGFVELSIRIYAEMKEVQNETIK